MKKDPLPSPQLTLPVSMRDIEHLPTKSKKFTKAMLMLGLIGLIIFISCSVLTIQIEHTHTEKKIVLILDLKTNPVNGIAKGEESAAEEDPPAEFVECLGPNVQNDPEGPEVTPADFTDETVWDVTTESDTTSYKVDTGEETEVTDTSEMPNEQKVWTTVTLYSDSDAFYGGTAVYQVVLEGDFCFDLPEAFANVTSSIKIDGGCVLQCADWGCGHGCERVENWGFHNPGWIDFDYQVSSIKKCKIFDIIL